MSVQDELAIRALVARYADAACRRDPDAWAATWAEDCRWDLGGGGSWDRIRQKKPDYYEANKARHPSGRFGRAEEVANVVAFLASPMASWVSGQNLVVDGSFTLRVGY